MSDTLLATLATYVPTPIAYQIATTPQLILQSHAQRITAAVVFVDLCGFTALADQLVQSSPSGVEDLTHILNAYFERVITLLELYGGQVVKFSGDALTVLFPALADSDGVFRMAALSDATQRATQAGQTMHNAMIGFATSLTVDQQTELKLKVSIAAGDVLAMQVGGIFGRWEYTIAGDALVQLAIVAKHTAPGQVVLSAAAYDQILDTFDVQPTTGECWIVHRAPPAVPSPLTPINWGARPQSSSLTVEAALRAYIPAAVTYRLNSGGGWLAEVRTMSILFAGIAGLDYGAPDAARWLQRFVTSVQEAVYRYEGALNKVTVDDKGTVLLVLFGTPPLVHNDDPARAIACAHDLQVIAHQQGLRMAIGLTTGTVFAGTVGSLSRREYTVIGDQVNTAARLMQVAGAHNTLCDEATACATEGIWTSEALPPMRLKGKAHFTRVYQPVATQRTQSVALAQPMFGRERELTQILQGLMAVQRGKMRILVINGQDGSGKTRLVQEVRRLFDHCEVQTLNSSVRFEQHRLCYRAWGDFLGSVFNVQMMNDGIRRIQVIADRARALHPNLRERLPLLNDIQNLGLPETDFTNTLNQSERHTHLSRLLADILQEQAQGSPLALILEDMHRADPLSWDLLLDLTTQLQATAILLILTLRPLEHISSLQLPPLDQLLALPECYELHLRGLPRTAVATLARHHLDLVIPPDELIDRLMLHTNGNPARIEQALRALPDPRYTMTERVVG